MKRVPADEFARHAAEYPEGTEPISVEKDGEVIGRYVPATNGHVSNGSTGPNSQNPNRSHDDIDWSTVKPASRAALEQLRRVLEDVYARTGMTEDELAEYFDTTKPFPYDLDPKP